MNFNTKGLLEPQIEHTKKLATSIFLNGVAWDGSETGVGKSFCASAIARHFDGPIVLVGPKVILNTWKGILEKFGKTPLVSINLEKLCRGNTKWLTYKKPEAKATNVKFRPNENAAPFLNAVIHFPAGSLVIVDEGHRCKGVNSLSAGFLIALKRQGYKTLILSATQATSPLDMRAFGYMTNLIPDASMKEYKKFCIDAGAEWTGHHGSMVFNDTDDKAQQKMYQVHQELFDFSKIGSRLTRDMMGTLFPENEIIVQSYDMGPNSQRIQHAYDVMEREIAKLNEKTANYSGHVFAEIMKMRRTTELLKVPTLLEMAEDLYDEGKTVIIFVNFTETIEMLGSRLERMRKFRDKNLIGYIYGGRTIKQREDDIKACQEDRKRIMIINIACAESIGLHDLTGRFPRATLISPSFSAIKVLQAIGRSHRQGGKSKVYQRFVFASNTYEEHICNRISSKMDNIELLNDGDLVGHINFLRFGKGKDI